MSSARTRTRAAQSGVERTNHVATAPPTLVDSLLKNLPVLKCEKSDKQKNYQKQVPRATGNKI